MLLKGEKHEQGTVYCASGGIHTPGAERPVSGNPAEGHDLAPPAQIFQRDGGIIPLHKAKEIVFSLSPKLVTEDEFLAFAEIARHECEDYYILGGDELYTDDEASFLHPAGCV